MSDQVTEKTRQYWIETLLGWAEDRLSEPQFDECQHALRQAAPAPAPAAPDLAAEVARLRAALAKYADRTSWREGHFADNCEWMGDGEGPDIANAALAGHDPIHDAPAPEPDAAENARYWQTQRGIERERARRAEAALADTRAALDACQGELARTHEQLNRRREG